MWRCTFLPAAGGTFLKYSGRGILSGFQSFPVWICLAGFMLLFLIYFLSDKYRIHWLYGVSVFLCCFGLGAGMTEEYLHRTDFPFSDEAAVYQVILLENRK